MCGKFGQDSSHEAATYRKADALPLGLVLCDLLFQLVMVMAFFWGDGVIAKGTPRVASQDSTHREPEAAHAAVSADGSDGVVGTGGVVATCALPAVQCL